MTEGKDYNPCWIIVVEVRTLYVKNYKPSILSLRRSTNTNHLSTDDAFVSFGLFL